MNQKTGMVIGAAIAGVLLIPLLFLLLLAGPNCGGGDAGSLSDAATDEIPAEILPMYVKAAKRWNLDVAFLASIGSQETDHGRNEAAKRVNWAGCIGLMQLGVGGKCGDFWGRNKCDGDGDGRMDVLNHWDNICAAAKGLRKEKGAPPAGGSEEGYYQAACNYFGACYYNGVAYGPEIMARAKVYGFVGGTATDASALPVSEDGASSATCGDEAVSGSEAGERAAQIAMRYLGKNARAEPFNGFQPPSTLLAWCSWFLTNVWKKAGIEIPVDWWSGFPYDWAASKHPDRLVKRVGQPATTLKLPAGTALMYGRNSGDSDHINMVRKLNPDGTVMIIGGNQGSPGKVTAYGPCRLTNGPVVRSSCDPRPIYGIVLPGDPGGDTEPVSDDPASDKPRGPS